MSPSKDKLIDRIGYFTSGSCYGFGQDLGQSHVLEILFLKTFNIEIKIMVITKYLFFSGLGKSMPRKIETKIQGNVGNVQHRILDRTRRNFLDETVGKL